jgi:hypothetical protein
MATFLTTPKMSPELVERIERRLSRGRPKTKLAQDLARPRMSVRARALVALAFAVVVGGFYALQVADKRELERKKQDVVAEVQRRRLQLPQDYRALLPKIERWAAEAAHDGGMDEVAVELRSKADLDTWLTRRAIYVNGPAAELRKPGTLASVAAASDKDAFLYCLLSPPAARSDTEVLAKVRGVNFGGAVVGDATKSVHRLHDAVQGLSAVSGALEGRLALTQSQAAVQKLAKELEHPPFEVTRESALAELLIVVAGDGPSARAILVDLTRDRLLLRIRRRTDAERASAVQKLHAAELSLCELALDVRAAAPP